MSRALRFTLVVSVLQIAMSLTPFARAGETLYNGITLPDEWPPRITELTREPMPVPYLDKRPDIVPIDVGRQLFVDDFLIEETTLKRVYHTATYHPASPVMRPDQPWENDPAASRPSAMVFSDGVWYDPAAKLFKMWYMGPFCQGTCYATSPDGIHWDKPSLDVVPGTNMVLKKFRDSSAIWLDQKETDPAKRYKMLLVTQRRDEKGGVDKYIYYSKDGIHWGEPVATQWAAGDRSSIFYNPFREKWVLSIRHDDAKVGRARMYVECDDLADGLNRKEELGRLWTCADRLDPNNPNPALKDVEPQIYNLDATPYESLMVGLFSVWQGDPGKPGEKRNEVLLGFSRDGFHWQRPDRRPFAGVDEREGAWNWGNVQTAGGGFLVVGDKLYFYVSGRGQHRAGTPASTGLALLRRDGFASMEAGETEGTLTTRPLTFNGSHLFINADARGGEIRVEVLDKDGNVYPALAKSFCMPMTTDSTIHRVEWMHSADVAALAGRPVRLRFHVNNAKLYAFWVSHQEFGASAGYVAAGGPGFTEPRDTVGVTAYEAAAATGVENKAAGATSKPASIGCVHTGETLVPNHAGETPASHQSAEWTCVTPHAPFTARDTAEGVTFAGKMWLSNGWRPRVGTSDATLSRDLWTSSDGSQWTQASDSTPYDPYSEMVVFKDQIWAVKESVWNSADGVQWHKVLDRTPFGSRGYGEAVVFNGRIWQLGSGTDVWSSDDGASWTCATNEAPFGTRAACAVAAFDNKLWLIGGRTDGENTPPEGGYKQFTTHNDVWCSADGATWTRVIEHGPWVPRMWSVAEVYAGRLWLIGGYDNRNQRNLGDVWTTTDGTVWEAFESKTRFAPRHEVTPYVFDASLWVVAGNTWPVVNDVWRLTLPEAGPAQTR